MSPRVSPRRAPLAVGVAVALCGVLAGCAGTSASENGQGDDTRYISGDGNVTEYKPADRKALKDVHGDGLDGRPLTLAGYKGKVVVVNFWASWCPPCRGETPSLLHVYDQNKAKGVEFLGVNFKDSKANAQAFERKSKVTYPSMFDANGQVTLAFREVPPSAIPSTLILDRQGRVAARIIGATTFSTLNPLVAKVSSEK
ncbi:TlpA disulfide reductase family protein [Actinomadura meridiana]|uniref:TlpA disulfide reductase family protein n=1 Tax=Actinomadura meridiana TaxID=559626 RepID=A0ABP8BRI3_9ACTN